MSKVLVTGAGGFIGSHVCEAVVRRGHSVRAMVRYTSHDQRGALAFADADTMAQTEIVTCDLRDAPALHRVVAGCDTILHLGAIIAIPYSYRSPAEVVETNVGGTVNLLEAARAHDVGRVVHTSTSEVYGTGQTEHMTEAHPLQAQSPYAATKIGADKIVESYVNSFGSPIVTIRPFNTYGPRQSPRAVIPSILRQALAGPVVKVGSLEPTRDFTFVTDTADAFARAADLPGIDGDVVHLGTGREVSIGDVVSLVEKVVGHPLDVRQEADRMRPVTSEVFRLNSDPGRAADVLGWHASVELEDGLAQTADWLRQHSSWFQLPDHAV